MVVEEEEDKKYPTHPTSNRSRKKTGYSGCYCYYYYYHYYYYYYYYY
jgi:hypothetical protein